MDYCVAFRYPDPLFCLCSSDFPRSPGLASELFPLKAAILKRQGKTGEIGLSVSFTNGYRLFTRFPMVSMGQTSCNRLCSGLLRSLIPALSEQMLTIDRHKVKDLATSLQFSTRDGRRILSVCITTTLALATRVYCPGNFPLSCFGSYL